MKSERHLYWQHFKALIDGRVPAVHRILGTPSVDLFVDKNGRRIGLHTPYKQKEPLNIGFPKEINVSIVEREGARFFEVSTDKVHLFPEFYLFLLSISDRIQLEGLNPAVALRETIAKWKELLVQKKGLSEEAKIGLLGELWLLKALIKNSGGKTVDCWVGPLGGKHDFRFDEHEIEVKSTRGEERVHTVHGIEQLTASPGLDLYILSFVFTDAGDNNGYSLNDLVKDCRGLIKDDPALVSKLENLLGKIAGYDQEVGEEYATRYRFRKPACIIPAKECPKIDEKIFSEIAGGFSDRISKIQYSISVEGLGHLEGTDEFAAIIPRGLDVIS